MIDERGVRLRSTEVVFDQFPMPVLERLLVTTSKTVGLHHTMPISANAFLLPYYSPACLCARSKIMLLQRRFSARFSIVFAKETNAYAITDT